MDSRTKNRQAAAVIRSMIAVAYGRDETPRGDGWITELERGWFNAVYAIRLASGRRVVLKIAPSPRTPVLTYERRALANELAALRVIAEQSAVPVPTVEFSDLSGDVIDAPWFFMNHIDGDNLGALLESGEVTGHEADAYMREVGAVNRTLNRLEGPAFGSVDRPDSSAWRDAFERMVADLLDDAHRAGVDIGVGDKRIQSAVTTHSGLLDEVTTPRLVMWDLWPGNVIVQDGRIAGVVDHERALWGDPLMETGFLGSEVPIYPGGAEFARGYGPLSSDGEARMRRLLYSLHLLLIMIIEPAFRGLQDPLQASWSRERLRELMTRLGS